MAKGFNFPILADVRDFLKGTGKIEEALDEVADSLDDLANENDLEKSWDDTARAADKAADSQTKDLARVQRSLDETGRDVDGLSDEAKKLERKFSDAWKEVRDDAKKTGKSIGDDVKKGTDEAAEGAKEFKDEAGGSAKEAAASFRGEFDDVADYLMDVAAQAFQGFGPAGAAAGVAAALGLGALIGSLEAGAEKAAETKDQVIELADQLAEVDGNPAALEWAENLRETLNEITNEKRWYEFWQKTPETRLEEWSRAAERFGVEMSDISKGLAGDTEAWDRVMSQLTHSASETEEMVMAVSSGVTQVVEVQTDAAKAADTFKTALEEEQQVTATAVEHYEIMDEALAGVSTAQADAAASVDDYASAVESALDGAGQAWETYATDGIVNLEEYNANIEAQAAAAQAFEQNLVTASQSLSDEALNYIRSMGPEAAPLLQAYIDAPLDQQSRTADNWSKIAATSNKSYTETFDITKPTEAEIKNAQRFATGSPVEVGFKLNDDLAYKVQQQVALVPTQTIRVNLESKPVVY